MTVPRDGVRGIAALEAARTPAPCPVLRHAGSFVGMIMTRVGQA